MLETMYVRCTHCGYDNSPEYRFCGMCGASLAHAPAPVKTPEKQVAGNGGNGQHNGDANGHRNRVLHEIEEMEQLVGKRMYRGLLKTVARVWNPKQIQDQAIQGKVLAHMQAAERGLRRAEAARERAGLAAFAGVLGSLRLSSLGQVDNLNTLQEIVVALEAAAPRAKE